MPAVAGHGDMVRVERESPRRGKRWRASVASGLGQLTISGPSWCTAPPPLANFEILDMPRNIISKFYHGLNAKKFLDFYESRNFYELVSRFFYKGKGKGPSFLEILH